MADVRRLSQTYAVVAGVWLLIMQALIAVILLRITISPEMDDEGLSILDKWLLAAAGWLGVIGFGVIILCGVTLLVVCVLKGRHLSTADSHNSVLFTFTGLLCAAAVVASSVWLLPDCYVAGPEKIPRIVFVVIGDFVLLLIVAALGRRIGIAAPSGTIRTDRR